MSNKNEYKFIIEINVNFNNHSNNHPNNQSEVVVPSTTQSDVKSLDPKTFVGNLIFIRFPYHKQVELTETMSKSLIKRQVNFEFRDEFASVNIAEYPAVIYIDSYNWDKMLKGDTFVSYIYSGEKIGQHIMSWLGNFLKKPKKREEKISTEDTNTTVHSNAAASTSSPNASGSSHQSNDQLNSAILKNMASEIANLVLNYRMDKQANNSSNQPAVNLADTINTMNAIFQMFGQNIQ